MRSITSLTPDLYLQTLSLGRTVGPMMPGTVGVVAPGGPPQGVASLAGLTSGRGTFGGNKRRRTASGGNAMSEAQEGKIKLAFFVAIVGVILTVLGVGTEYWVELSPPKSFYNNQTCVTAHYGLWKGCTKTLWVADIDPERENCGPAELPGESNCTYFKFFTTGENAVMFQKTTQKNLNIATATLALVSLFLMVMGAICITMSLSKEILFFLKPASVCFILSGILVLLSLVVFHQSVMAFLASDHTVPLDHKLSWSVSCIGCAGAVLIVGGILFLLLALPCSPWQRCLPQKDSSSS
ncbi:voltage-dependent calcium channel gamma-6 subunit-like isoform X2 [Thunnus albacares]|uniref:voltage-dependent calcium channel gamma-6 subunit-like isoform X2 n=1 Tax=Thunnus maccoyii TaxID=8240 RepID=UPI001C4CD0CB|nr:voltage-dependent calcium channel gamma-6 subunit-like isoform X2 [Thunnus maccoyii]XP_044191907.1 voltage-dependent calcium channel gamma-6 subunit-like isoform X2 [Thunnus albacares]